MQKKNIFVGRKKELKRFEEVLQDQQGQTVLVVGPPGMGKTELLNKMIDYVVNHLELKCGAKRYEVVPTDDVDSIMMLMMDDAFEVARVKERSWDITSRRLEQLRGLLNILRVGDLVSSLVRDKKKTARADLLKRLEVISKRMPRNGRAIFVIDPEKYILADSDQAWAAVTDKLPDKIKLLFAQRPDDVLVNSESFNRLDNVVYIADNGLVTLDKEEVKTLVQLWAAEFDRESGGLLEPLSKYYGHPYALQGALGLLSTGTSIDKLPQDPSGIAIEQWREICRRGSNAVCLFEAYAVLEICVHNQIVEYVAGIDSSSRKSLLADSYLCGLVRQEREGSRIYHTILADHILTQIGDEEKKKYYGRLVEVYSRGLHNYSRKERPGLIRLSHHIFSMVNAKQENIISRAVKTWLAEHEKLLIAWFIYRSWLDAGGDIDFVRESLVIWLEKYKTVPEASFIYKSWLDAGGDIEFVRECIEAWLEKHKTLPEAQFVYKPWLDTGGDIELVREHIEVWLEKHKTLPEARFVYQPWLDTGGDIELVHESIEVWLDNYKTLPEARFVYKSWLDAGGDIEFVNEYIEAWLEKHKTLPEAQFVYKSWLDAGGDIELVRESIEVWLEKHKTLPEARFVYQPWLDAGGNIEFVRDYIEVWINKHKTLTEARFVYKPWLDAGGDIEFMRESIEVWLDEHKMVPEASFVYKSWLNSGGNIEFVRDCIEVWLNEHKMLPEAQFVYKSWLDAGGDIESVHKSIEVWLEKHKTLPEARFVYQSWLNAGGDIEFVREYVLVWLYDHGTTKDAVHVYTPWFDRLGNLKGIQAYFEKWCTEQGFEEKEGLDYLSKKDIDHKTGEFS